MFSKSTDSIPLTFRILLKISVISVIIQFLTQTVHGKVFERCELAKILRKNRIRYDYLDDWLCLVTWGNGFNTSVINPLPFGTFYGILSISNKVSCHDGDNSTKQSCNLSCTAFIDENLQDDIQCARNLRILDGNFESWPWWNTHCKDRDLSNYTSGCMEKYYKKPQILTPEDERNVIFYRNLDFQYIDCKASGFPRPSLIWNYNMTKFPEAVETWDHTSEELNIIHKRLIFPTADFDQDEFTCHAVNSKGQELQKYFIKVIEEEPKAQMEAFVINLQLFAAICVFSILIIVSLSLAIYHKYLLKVYGLTDAEIKLFELGAPLELVNYFCRKPQTARLTLQTELIQLLPYDQRYEIPSGELLIKNDEVLGSGHFGVVYKGEYKGIRVAVKTPKVQADNTYVKALLTEIKILIHIGQHSNVVNLVGAQTKGLRRAQLYVAVELCELGDLEHYLRSQRQYFVDPDLPSGYISGGSLTSEARNTEPMTHLDLLLWSCQIASGMAHLECKKVLHGDLACRNVLLFNKNTAKISDFGLSRQLYTQSNYVKTKETPLPWRWMAIESLTKFSFCTKSDIWSFGVTLWEIFSLGDVPYPGLSWSQDFPNLLKSGLRLLKPNHASEIIYKIMQDCWKLDPDTRPDFVTLNNILIEYNNDLLQNVHPVMTISATED